MYHRSQRPSLVIGLEDDAISWRWSKWKHVSAKLLYSIVLESVVWLNNIPYILESCETSTNSAMDNGSRPWAPSSYRLDPVRFFLLSRLHNVLNESIKQPHFRESRVVAAGERKSRKYQRYSKRGPFKFHWAGNYFFFTLQSVSLKIIREF